MSAAESLAFCRIRTWSFSYQYDLLHFCINEDTCKLIFFFIFFSIISFVFVFFLTKFLFCFSKFSNLKDQLDFHHLSHKLNCLIRILSNFMHQISVANYNLEAMPEYNNLS